MMAIIVIGICWLLGSASVLAALMVSGNQSQAEHRSGQRSANLKVISGGIAARPADHIS
jgi:hypothetical protein